MIFVYDYTTTVKLGSVEPTECTITNSYQTFPTANVKIKTSDAKEKMDYLLLNNSLKIPGDYAEDWFHIVDVDVDTEYTTLKCEHITSAIKNAYTYKASWDASNFRLYSVAYILYYACMGTSPIFFMDNNILADANTSNTKRLKVRAFWKTDSGYNFMGYDTYHVPSATSDPLWMTDYHNPDILYKSVEDIINIFIDEFDMNVIYINNTIVLTTQTASTFYQWLFNNTSALDDYSDMKFTDARHYNPRVFFGNDESAIQVQATNSSFTASVIPYCSWETNDRTQTETYDEPVMDGTSPVVVTNSAYSSIYGEEGANRYRTMKKYSPTRTWDRGLKMNFVSFDCIYGKTTSEVAFEKELKLSTPITQYTYMVPTYDAFGHQLSSAYGVTSENWTYWYVNDDGETQGGYIKATLKSSTTTEWVYTLKVTCYPNYYHGVKNGSSQTASRVLATDKTETEQKIYNIFGDVIGYCNTTAFTDSTSTTTKFMVQSVPDSNNLFNYIGYCFITKNEAYNTYYNALKNEVLQLAQTDADAQDYNNALQSVKLSFLSQPIDNIILPGDQIVCWVPFLQTKAEFVCSSITYNCLSNTYDDIQVGYKRANLKLLHKKQKTAEDILKNVKKEIKSLKKLFTVVSPLLK